MSIIVHTAGSSFCTAHALIVALESKGLQWLSPESLLLVGEARAELTDYDTYRPTRYLHQEPATAAGALDRLREALEALSSETASGGAGTLPDVLRVGRARDLLDQAATDPGVSS